MQQVLVITEQAVDKTAYGGVPGQCAQQVARRILPSGVLAFGEERLGDHAFVASARGQVRA